MRNVELKSEWMKMMHNKWTRVLFWGCLFIIALMAAASVCLEFMNGVSYGSASARQKFLNYQEMPLREILNNLPLLGAVFGVAWAILVRNWKWRPAMVSAIVGLVFFAVVVSVSAQLLTAGTELWK